jgi:hypothetical protein
LERRKDDEMNPVTPDSENNPTEKRTDDSLADDLRQQSEKLRELADKLKAREEELSEMEANYPAFRAFVYAKMREYFEKTLPELPDKELDAIVRDENAEPLDAFIEELERMV